MFRRFTTRVLTIRVLTTLVLVTLATLTTHTYAIDLPVFYRAPFFAGEAKQNVSDFTSHLDFRYAEGSTRKSYNTGEDETCLFNAHGPIDLRKLAANLENLNSFPKTKAYANGPIPKLGHGKLAFTGRLKVEEFDITFEQSLLYGLYLQAYFPIRKLEIDEIAYVNTSTSKTKVDLAEQKKLTDFVDNQLDAILAEHCIKPLKTSFKATELVDPMISLGWHGHCTFSNNIITALRGYLQAGIILPVGSRRKIDRIFTIPFGNSKHWGINARFNIHGTIKEKFAIGVNAGTSIFIEQTYDQRLTTTFSEGCLEEPIGSWITLQKGRAKVDQGTQWDATIYAKAERVFGGFSALVAYSYVQQEDTILDLANCCVLETALKNEIIKNKNEVINSNKLLKQWYQHTLHAYAEYDFGAHTNKVGNLFFRVSYHYPILGKHTWLTDMVAGTIGTSISWSF